ncbi:hypothetical protein BD779DRAFT_1550702 [Infundibulicybe gibba]|nr:hypothetical protein BD779DRAFT_1550702 [Infundibulicybe gibba]
MDQGNITGATAAWESNWPPPGSALFLCYSALFYSGFWSILWLCSPLDPHSLPLSASFSLRFLTFHLHLSFSSALPHVHQVPLLSLSTCLRHPATQHLLVHKSFTLIEIVILKLSTCQSILSIYSMSLSSPRTSLPTTSICLIHQVLCSR